MNKMNILTCEGVCKMYGSGNNQVTALDGIDLTVGKGEFVAVIGASGSGKSTLLHILGSVDKPTSGKVTIDGTDLAKLNQTQAAIFRRRKVGLVYQFYNLIPTLTVQKNILMPLALDKKKPNKEYFEKIVRSLGLAERLEALPNQLSGGQQQRVAIARALASNAPVLLADEPTGNLDEDTANEIIAIFSGLAHERNKCVIMVTHSKELAQKADVILTLKKGSIVETEDAAFDEKIREGLAKQAERFSASDDLKDKIMQEIEKQSN